jgi:hypothetical protein
MEGAEVVHQLLRHFSMVGEYFVLCNGPEGWNGTKLKGQIEACCLVPLTNYR